MHLPLARDRLHVLLFLILPGPNLHRLVGVTFRDERSLSEGMLRPPFAQLQLDGQGPKIDSRLLGWRWHLKAGSEGLTERQKNSRPGASRQTRTPSQRPRLTNPCPKRPPRHR